MSEYQKIKEWLLENGYDTNSIFRMSVDNLAHTIESYNNHKENSFPEKWYCRGGMGFWKFVDKYRIRYDKTTYWSGADNCIFYTQMMFNTEKEGAYFSPPIDHIEVTIEQLTKHYIK